MDIQKLKYFYEVAKYQHVTKAAESISIAQPALTQAIKMLEKELGVSLFVKQGRNIVLTDFGIYLKKRLDTILPEIDSLPEEIEQMKGRVNRTIKLNILAASNFVIDAIVEYRKKNPDVIFGFEQNASVLDCDIVVSTNGSKDTDTKRYKKHSIKEEQIYLAVPKNSVYSGYKSIDLREVRDEGFIMLSSARLFGIVCNRFCSSAGFVPDILFESDSPAAVQNMVSLGAGISFWPKYSWGKINNKDVVLLPISNPTCQRQLIIELHDRLPKSEYAENFYEFLLRRCEV